MNMNGELVRSFNEKWEAGKSFFKTLFEEPKGYNIQEILKVINLFPRLIDEEMNKSLRDEVIEEELEKIVYSIHKGKSPGLNGITIEIF